MSWLGWALVIFLTALVTMLGTAWWTGRGLRELDRIRLLNKQAVNPYCPEGIPGCKISHAGYPRPEVGPFDLPEVLASVYGPFPVDTGPLLILSEKAAANVALEREIEQRCAEAEAKIPPRWR